MTTDELEDLIKRLVAKGMTVLLVTLGPAGELVTVTPDAATDPQTAGSTGTGPDRPSLALEDGACVVGGEGSAGSDTGASGGTEPDGDGSSTGTGAGDGGDSVDGGDAAGRGTGSAPDTDGTDGGAAEPDGAEPDGTESDAADGADAADRPDAAEADGAGESDGARSDTDGSDGAESDTAGSDGAESDTAESDGAGSDSAGSDGSDGAAGSTADGAGGPDAGDEEEEAREGTGDNTTGGDIVRRPGAGTTPTGCPTPGGDDTADSPGPAPSEDDATAGDAGVTAEGTTAAATLGWGEPVRTDDFTEGTSGWNIYDGAGHDGNGTRTPDAVSVQDGILTITGDAEGNTGGMAWTEGSQRYGRWEGRVRAPAADPSYNALLLLWPTAENWPEGGELDFMEMMDPARQTTNAFFHYGADNSQVEGSVEIDGTQWHNWALEWTPERITAYVDGEQWFETTDPQVQPPGPMHLCIQLDWFPEGGDVQESRMDVDWVRQYTLDT